MYNNRDRSISLLLLVLFLASFFSSCKWGNSEVSASLDRIEQVVEQHPDSALIELVRLDSLLDADAVHLEGDAQHARYALLKTQTHDKNFIDDINDSLIMRAVRYYDEHGSDHERVLAHFYHGSIQRNNSDNSQAYSSFLMAADLSNRIQDKVFHGKSFMNLSLVCYRLGSFDAIAFSDSAYLDFKSIGDSVGMAWALVYKAKSLSYYRHTKEAESIFKAVLSMTDSSLIAEECRRQYINQCVRLGEFEKASMLMDELTTPYSFNDYINKVYVDIFRKDYSLAKEDVSKAKEFIEDDNDSTFYYTALRNIDLESSDYHGAYNALARRFVLQDSIIRTMFSRTVASAQKDYLQQKNEHIEYVAANRKRTMVLSSFIILLLLFGGILYIIIKRREHQQAISVYVEKASILEKVLLEQKDKISALQTKVKETSEELEINIKRKDTDIKHAYSEFEHRIDLISAEQEARERKHIEQVKLLYANRFIELNNLCESFYHVQGKIDEQKQIYKKLRMLIDSFVEPTQQKKLDSIIDANFNDTMKKVKSALIGLNDMELQLYRLRVSGFSTPAICFIMNFDNQPAVKKRIQRLRKTILKSDSPYKEEIASLM